MKSIQLFIREISKEYYSIMKANKVIEIRHLNGVSQRNLHFCDARQYKFKSSFEQNSLKNIKLIP